MQEEFNACLDSIYHVSIDLRCNPEYNKDDAYDAGKQLASDVMRLRGLLLEAGIFIEGRPVADPVIHRNNIIPFPMKH